MKKTSNAAAVAAAATVVTIANVYGLCGTNKHTHTWTDTGAHLSTTNRNRPEEKRTNHFHSASSEPCGEQRE